MVAGCAPVPGHLQESEEQAMQVISPRCAGLDVHQKTVVVTAMLTQQDGTVQREQRTFSTMTVDLLVLDDWLHQRQIEVIALESTGVYWRPVYTILEEGRTVSLVNARHMKAVPGRKTDLKDSEWIADLLRHGLLQASFIPPRPIREIRELTGYRQTLIQERADEVNRLQKVLELANVKLGAVATNVVGKSGRDMLTAIIGEQQDPEVLAELARGGLRAKLPQVRQALEGRVEAYHRFLLERLLAHIDFLEQSIAVVQQEIQERLQPYEEAAHLLSSIPTLQAAAIATVISAIGGIWIASRLTNI
jgi:transposase